MPPEDTSLLSDLLETSSERETTRPRPRTDHEIENAYSNISFRVIYQSNNFFLPQIQSLINGREVINLRPEYQRRLRWSAGKKSRLIESLLLNVPIPPIYLYESELARYEVMDGQQRLNSVHDFLENNFPLVGLEKLNFLNGRRYNRLPPMITRNLARASISAIVLLQESKTESDDPYTIRRYVFERLNTGGEKLNPQEMRNSIFRGNFNDMIVELARNSTFCEIFDIPLYTETDENEYYENPQRQKNRLYKTMSDCQLVLRFFSLKDDSHIRGSMQSILDNCMKRYQRASASRLSELRQIFEQTILACKDIFGNEVFQLPPDEQGVKRLSTALYDACMAAVARRLDQQAILRQKRSRIRSALNESISQQLELFTGKANTSQSIKDRIERVGSILDAAINQ